MTYGPRHSSRDEHPPHLKIVPGAWAGLERFGSLCRQFVRRLTRIRRSRRYYRWGEGASSYYRGSARAALVPDLFYRRSLRELPPASTAGIDVTPHLSGWALRQAAASRLAEYEITAWIRRNLRVASIIAASILIPVIIAMATFPALRKSVFPPDLAAGKQWSASSAWTGYTGSGVMSEPKDRVGIFHTVEEPSPSVTVDLGLVTVVRQVKVYNRLDAYQDRALPLILEVSADRTTWHRVGYRRAQFDTWSALFPARPARYVRARVERTSVLHLRGIRVY